MAPQVYELRFKGAASETLAAGFEGFELTTCGDTSTIRAVVPDQAALQGIIGQVHGFGLELLEVRMVESL